MNEVYKEESARSAINNASNVAIKEIDKLYAEIRFLRSRNDELESYKANNGGQGEYWQFMAKNERELRLRETAKSDFSLLMMIMAFISTFLMAGLVAWM